MQDGVEDKSMTNLNAIVLIMAIGLAHFYVFILFDRMRKELEGPHQGRPPLGALPAGA